MLRDTYERVIIPESGERSLARNVPADEDTETDRRVNHAKQAHHSRPVNHPANHPAKTSERGDTITPCVEGT